MNKKIITVDIDDVLCEFIPEFLKWYNDGYGTSFVPEDMTTYSFSRHLGITNPEAKDQIRDFYRTPEFTNLPIIGRAYEGLSELKDNGYELIGVTSRFPESENVTRQYLDKNFGGLIEKVFHSNRKGKLIADLGAKVHVDDASHNITCANNYGTPGIIYTKPWNVGLEGPMIKRANNWEEIIKYIK